MSIIQSGKKKTFKIVLDSNQTTSFTGKQFDANYIIDLTKILPEPDDYNRAYEMSFTFRSRSGAPGTTNLNMNDVYTLSLELGKGFNVYSFVQGRNYVGILPIGNDFTAYTSTVCPTFFDCKATDNDPILVRDLTGITNIRLSVVASSTNTIFNSADDGTINTNTKYVCVLTFKQL